MSPRALVSSYLTVSPLPTANVEGGFFSVALSLGFLPLGITQHPALRSPDFPRAVPASESGRWLNPRSSSFHRQSYCSMRDARQQARCLTGHLWVSAFRKLSTASFARESASLLFFLSTCKNFALEKLRDSLCASAKSSFSFTSLTLYSPAI